MPRLAPPIRAVLRRLALAAIGLLPSAVLGQGCPCGTLADEFRAADAGLVREWIVQVPFDSAGWRLERVAVGDGLVVAESGDGGVHAIRSATLQPRLAFSGVERYPDFVFLLRAQGDGGAGDRKPRRMRIEGPDAFTVSPTPEANRLRERLAVTALKLFAVQKAAYEDMTPQERESLTPDGSRVLAVDIAVDAINAGHQSVARFGVSIVDGELAVVPQPELAGTVAWSRRVAAAAGHSWPATIGSRLVMVASEMMVHALDRDTGAVEWERPTGSLTAAPAVQSGGWVYVPLATNRLLRLPANPRGGPVTLEPQSGDSGPGGRKSGKPTAPPAPPERIDPVMIDAGGRFQFTPFPLDTGVLWATDGGLSTLERTALGWIRHRLPESPRPSWARPDPVSLAGAPAVRGKEFYVALSSGALARVDLDAEDRPGLRTTWATLLPDLASAGPMVSGTVVVVTLGPSGVAAFSAQDGRPLWRSDVVGTLVATAGGRAWLHDSAGRLTALDIDTGSRRQSLCLGCFTLPVVNAFSERLVLASPGGLVVSLAPPRAVSAGGTPPREPAPTDPAATPP